MIVAVLYLRKWRLPVIEMDAVTEPRCQMNGRGIIVWLLFSVSL